MDRVGFDRLAQQMALDVVATLLPEDFGCASSSTPSASVSMPGASASVVIARITLSAFPGHWGGAPDALAAS